MEQLTTFSVREPRCAERWQELFSAIRDAIHAITPKELAFRLDVQPSYLNDALRGADRKSVKFEWLPLILEMAPEDEAKNILAAQAAWRSYRLERIPVRTPEQELSDMRGELGRLAPGLLKLIDEAMRKRAG